MVSGGPSWLSARKLREHFRKHGHEVGATNLDEYDTSARETIRLGRRFTYADKRSGLSRVGYFESGTDRFTSLTDRETVIITHFVADDHYVRNVLPSSTYS